MDPYKENLYRFCEQHGLKLETKGECGFGRPCVGLIDKRGDHYLDFNPYDEVNYEPISELQEDRMHAPKGVDAYHKHDCFAVLVHNDDYEEGLRQLNQWIEHLESIGAVEVKEYSTGATGLQAFLSGVKGYALVFKR